MPHPFFEASQYPWSLPEATELKELLCVLYPSSGAIKNFCETFPADQAKGERPVRLDNVNFDQPLSRVWEGALQALTQQSRIKDLCERIRSAFPKNPTVTSVAQKVFDAIEIPQPAPRPLPPSLLLLIKAMTLAQFLALLGRLQIDAGGLVDRASPDERLAYFGQWASGKDKVEVEQSLNAVLGVRSSDEATLQLVRDRITDATAQMDRAAHPATSQPLARQVIEQIACIRSAKQVHDTIQHGLAYQLPVFARVALDLTNKPKARSSAFSVVHAVMKQVQQTSDVARALRPKELKRVETANARLLKTLNSLDAALNPDAAVDESTGPNMTTTLDMELRPYVLQIPSRMNEIIVDESASIPWESLSTIATGGVAASRADQASFSALQSLFDELVDEHGSWQSVNNELAHVAERLDTYFPTPGTTVANEVRFVMRNIRELAEAVPLAAECQPLVNKLWTALKLEKTDPPQVPDEDDVRSRLEQLLAFVNDSFDKSDKQLLGACDELKTISESLQKFA